MFALPLAMIMLVPMCALAGQTGLRSYSDQFGAGGHAGIGEVGEQSVDAEFEVGSVDTTGLCCEG